ncbi:MAG: NifU family protein [Acidobacteriaceae bacterium]|nr:NifU family protein [Acidobacteriaceae bacterium]
MERAIEELERLADADARGTATAAVQALLELYGAGLERLVELVAAADDGTLARAFADDQLISHLLLVHGLHPVALEDRLTQALDEVRPYLESHGGDVELLEIAESTVTLRMRGSCSGCPSSAMTLKLAIESAIEKAAPEIERVIAQDDEPAKPNGNGLLQIELAPALAAPASVGAPAGTWETAGSLTGLSDGKLMTRRVAGHELLFMRIAGGTYGYRPECPSCSASLSGGMLDATELACPSCASRYDVVRAGRCLDSPQLHLEPVPLVVGDDGLVRVALAVAA